MLGPSRKPPGGTGGACPPPFPFPVIAPFPLTGLNKGLDCADPGRDHAIVDTEPDFLCAWPPPLPLVEEDVTPPKPPHPAIPPVGNPYEGGLEMDVIDNCIPAWDAYGLLGWGKRKAFPLLFAAGEDSEESVDSGMAAPCGDSPFRFFVACAYSVRS